MKPEFELLVRCCGIARNIPKQFPPAQAQFPAGFDEGLFVRFAAQHKTAATAQTGLKRLGLALKPENAGKLRQFALQGRMLRELIVEGASAITEAAAKAGIPVLVLKGPASSLQLYGDAFVREYTDLDLLVNLPTIDPALPFMTALGWEPDDYSPAEDSGRAPSRLVMRGHHVVFWKKGCPFRVELHDRTSWERELFARDNIDGIFARAVRLEQDGKALFAPALPDHAALIIAHGTQHAWALLHWLIDATVIAAIPGVETQRTFAARICSLNMQCQLKLACELSRKLYTIELPPAFESAIICQAPLDKSVAFAFARLQAGASDMSTFRNMIDFRFTYASPLFRTARGKFSSAFMLFLIPPQDIEALPLPRPLLFLHLFLRPFFVLSRRIQRLREKLRHERESKVRVHG